MWLHAFLKQNYLYMFCQLSTNIFRETRSELTGESSFRIYYAQIKCDDFINVETKSINDFYEIVLKHTV